MSSRAQWDEEWRQTGHARGWRLPPPAPWPLRLWGVRYLRAMVAAARLIQKENLWQAEACPTSYDDWVIYAIARGWC